MKVTKQMNLELAEKFGFTGQNASEIDNQIHSLMQETDDNIDRRKESSTYRFWGLSVNIPDSVIKPVQKCCSQDGKRYSFLYKKEREDLLKTLISHYMFDDKPLSAENAQEAIDRAVTECQRLNIEPERISSNVSYLRTWLIYKLNQILTNYIS